MFILRHTTVRLYMMQHNMTSGIGHPAPDNLHPYNNSPRYRANPFAWYSTNMSPLRSYKLLRSNKTSRLSTPKLLGGDTVRLWEK